MRRTLIACVVTALVLGGGTATAASLFTGASVTDGSLTGRDIKDGSLKKKDIKSGAVSESRLSRAVRTKLNKSVSGSPGQGGTKGDKGDKGDRGPAAPANGGLPDGFFVTNNTVGMTLSGIMFGDYPDAGAAGGSLYYGGVNGKKLSDITSLAYTFRYSASDAAPIAAPYLRIFLNGDTARVVFDATKCATVVPAQDTSLTYEVTSGDVRYNDDSCDGVAPDQQPWATVVAAHGNEVISGIYVTTGFTGGHDVRASLGELKVNGSQFHFGG